MLRLGLQVIEVCIVVLMGFVWGGGGGGGY